MIETVPTYLVFYPDNKIYYQNDKSADSDLSNQ